MLRLSIFSSFLGFRPRKQSARKLDPLVRPQLPRNEQLPTTHTPKSGILESLPSL